MKLQQKKTVKKIHKYETQMLLVIYNLLFSPTIMLLFKLIPQFRRMPSHVHILSLL